MKPRKTLALIAAGSLLLCACGVADAAHDDDEKEPFAIITPMPAEESTSPESKTETEKETGEYFSDRDMDFSRDEDAVLISLEGDKISCSSTSVELNGSTATVKSDGCYIIRGSLKNGAVIVDADKEDKLQLVLDGAEISSENSAAIYIKQADKVFITLAESSENSLSSTGEFAAVDENNIDAALFSKDDLTVNGLGKLSVSSPEGHGIVSKDSLKICGAEISVECSGHGLSANDDICISGAAISVNSGKDGLHAENDENEELGYIYLEKTSLDISAQGDGISASSAVTVAEGEYRIISGGGSAEAPEQTDRMPGMGMGGIGPGGGSRGGAWQGGGRYGSRPSEGFTPPGWQMPQADEKEQTGENTVSTKGIKADRLMNIKGGIFVIDSADDTLHSNGSLEISNGEFELTSGDDAIHSEEELWISGGSINIGKSYEGIEALHINISGGSISAVSADDGLNAAGGTDQSGFGGRDMGSPPDFSPGSGSITVSGGDIFIIASGDGIDANGSLEITGGKTVVTGPTGGDTATLDYDTEAIISGGTFIGTGAYGMAQTFSASENQGVIAVGVGNQDAGTEIRLENSDGEALISYAPELSYCVVILSSPDIVKGESYNLHVGDLNESFEAY